MDISLLSKMVRELVLDHDEVGLPGLGTLAAEIVPASFSDRGYAINPPYRRLTFIPGQADDLSLVRYYAARYEMDESQAELVIRRFAEQLKQRLIEEKTVVFPGLGRLRATRQNHFFFITDEDLDIYPDGFGLPGVSLKNRPVREEELRDAVQELASIVDGAVPEPLVEPAAAVEEGMPEPEEPELLVEPAALEAEPESEPAAPDEAEPLAEQAVPEEPVEAPVPVPARRRRSRWWLVPLVIVSLAAVALAAFVVLSHAAPDFIDSILYTPEELGIINY